MYLSNQPVALCSEDTKSRPPIVAVSALQDNLCNLHCPCGTGCAVQVNQVKGLYVEDSKIYGSGPNGVGLDGVAVQYGHVCRSVIHHADWCMYLKGEAAGTNCQ